MVISFKDRSVFNNKQTPTDLLVDSDALIALLNKEDLLHQRAVKIQKKLALSGCNFAISRYIIAEVATFLTLKISRKIAIRFLKDLEKQAIAIVEPSKELEKLTKEIFLAQKSHQVTYFDCANMAILKKYHWPAIFSFDKHYRQNNFRLAEEII